MSESSSVPVGVVTRAGSVTWNLAALSLAMIASSGSLYLSLGLGLKACPLCFYQRSFALAAVLIVAMLMWVDGMRSFRACLVALPVVVSGLGVAAFHVYLVQFGKLECPPAIFGWGDGPLQSLAVFVALTFACFAGAWSSRFAEGQSGLAKSVGAVLMGCGVAWGCIASAPPLPPTPKQPYDAIKQPFDMCRPPFPGA